MFSINPNLSFIPHVCDFPQLCPRQPLNKIMIKVAAQFKVHAAPQMGLKQIKEFVGKSQFSFKFIVYCKFQIDRILIKPKTRIKFQILCPRKSTRLNGI